MDELKNCQIDRNVLNLNVIKTLKSEKQQKLHIIPLSLLVHDFSFQAEADIILPSKTSTAMYIICDSL